MIPRLSHRPGCVGTVSQLGFIEVLLVAVGLAMDAFAVCLGAATTGRAHGARAAFRLCFHFGLFQGLMPAVGWLLGVRLAGAIEAFDHWVAFGLLAFVGVRMIRSGLDPEFELSGDPSRGSSLIALAVATSIDAMAVGLGLAMLHVSIWIPCLVIGLVTLVMCVLGFLLGRMLGARFGKRAEVLGGVILIVIGLRILLSHVLG
jgi:putative Mn2+ efflux pump MntP